MTKHEVYIDTKHNPLISSPSSTSLASLWGLLIHIAGGSIATEYTSSPRPCSWKVIEHAGDRLSVHGMNPFQAPDQSFRRCIRSRLLYGGQHRP